MLTILMPLFGFAAISAASVS